MNAVILSEQRSFPRSAQPKDLQFLPALSTHRENGCPIQASLGWDSASARVGFVILRSPRRPKDLRLLVDE